jgi:hypothetical protein
VEEQTAAVPSPAPETPRERIVRQASVAGRGEFARQCAAVLAGADADDDLIRVLAGQSAPWFLARRDDDDIRYWQRVWAARAPDPDRRPGVTGPQWRRLADGGQSPCGHWMPP